MSLQGVPACFVSSLQLLGGLGVTDLRCAGVALRVRWKWLRRVDGQRTWSSLPDVNDRLVVAVFQAATTINLGDGATAMFWTDNWLDGSCIRVLAPTVFAAVPKRHRSTSVAEALNNRAWVRHITGPRTMRLINEFLSLWAMVEQVQLTPGVPDTFAWCWSSDGVYSAASAYGAMFAGSSAPLGAKLIWKTAAPPRVRFFFWLVMHGRCWTAHRRRRHGLQDTDACIFCDQAAETIDHVILGYVFSREVWATCLRWLRLDSLVHVREENTMVWWSTVRKLLSKTLCRGSIPSSS